MPPQDAPGRPFLTDAADQLGRLTPPPLAAQTIRVGRFDGADNGFAWLLDERYPPGTPESVAAGRRRLAALELRIWPHLAEQLGAFVVAPC
jgi:hypothetical protein